MLPAHWLPSVARSSSGQSVTVRAECLFVLRESTCCETGPLVGIISGWPGGTVGRCATRDCVIKKTDYTCVKCIHVLCFSIYVVSLDPLGLL